MRKMFLAFVSLATAALLSGCGSESATPLASPLVEANLAGNWSMVQSTPAGRIKVTMIVTDDHAMTVVSSLPASPTDSLFLAEVSRENMTWTLESDVWKSVKTTCFYADPGNPTAGPQAFPCRSPLQKSSPTAVKGNHLTVIEGTAQYTFTKP